MNTGDTFTDSLDRPWVVDSALGRGTWSRTWALRSDGGATAVLKVPLEASDFRTSDGSPVAGADALAADAAEVSLACQAALGAAKQPFLPKLQATLPRRGPIPTAAAASMFASRHAAVRVLDLVVRILHQLAHATPGGAVHGNLPRPTCSSTTAGVPCWAAAVRQGDRQAVAAGSARPAPALRHRDRAAGPACPRAEGHLGRRPLYRAALQHTWVRPRPAWPHRASARTSPSASPPSRTPPPTGVWPQTSASRATDRLGAVLNRGLSAERGLPALPLPLPATYPAPGRGRRPHPPRCRERPRSCSVTHR